MNKTAVRSWSCCIGVQYSSFIVPHMILPNCPNCSVTHDGRSKHCHAAKVEVFNSWKPDNEPSAECEQTAVVLWDRYSGVIYWKCNVIKWVSDTVAAIWYHHQVKQEPRSPHSDLIRSRLCAPGTVEILIEGHSSRWNQFWVKNWISCELRNGDSQKRLDNAAKTLWLQRIYKSGWAEREDWWHCCSWKCNYKG